MYKVTFCKIVYETVQVNAFTRLEAIELGKLHLISQDKNNYRLCDAEADQLNYTDKITGDIVR